MKITPLAAIDIGSNSIRLLVSNVIKDKRDTTFKKIALIRLPIRLGADVFTELKISSKTEERLLDGMRAFSYLMKVHGISDYRACATSAMRDSENGAHIIKKIEEKTGIHIEIINGEEEARLIFQNEFVQKLLNEEDGVLYIDVGGGSTELTHFVNGKITASKSFNIGTVRLLNNLVGKDKWDEMRAWIKEHVRSVDFSPVMVGSGGNINRIFKMSGKLAGTPLSVEYLESTYEFLQKFDNEERITKLDLNPDRSDVIVHATKIYLSVMKWAKAEQIYVPKMGLADGMVRAMYQDTMEP
jgi:exopolyphosphatase/guanosine-5'-triphosphate,3'-diphosphate pyrophosphatase